MAFKFLPLVICFLLWSWSCSSFLYTTERYLSIYSLSWQVILVIVVDCVDHLHIGSCVKFVLFIAFFASCKDPNLHLVVFSVVNKIWRVMIPCACILYSNANVKNNAWILGEHSFYLEHYPIYQYFILSIGICFFILFWYLQLVLIGI